MTAPILGAVALVVASWVPGVVAYLGMMAGPAPATVKLHCARLRVRASMLAFACPELFEGRAAVWRRLYIGALGCVTMSFLAAVAFSVLLPS